MINLLGAEWVKLRHRWMPRIITLIMLAILALLFFGISTGSNRNDVFFPRGLIVVLAFAGFMSSFLWPVLAGAWAGNEYGWGTIRLALSRRPSRIQFVLASIGILCLCVVLALILALILATIEGGIVALVTGNSLVSTHGLASDFALVFVKALLAVIYVTTFYLVLAFSAGTIFQSGAAGIGIGIGFSIAQGIIGGIFSGLGGTWKVIADHFPSAYTAALPDRIAGQALTGGVLPASSGTPGVIESILWLALYIGALLAVTLLIVNRRDVTA